MTNDNQKSGSSGLIAIVILVVFVLLCALGSCSSSGSSDRSSSGSVRCSYCGKVIYSNGRAIHCTNKYLNTYKCDYCGHSNVIK